MLDSVKAVLHKFKAQVELPMARVQRNVSLDDIAWLRDQPRSGYHLQSLKNMEDILSAARSWCVFISLVFGPFFCLVLNALGTCAVSTTCSGSLDELL